jgi:hypothetical protein
MKKFLVLALILSAGLLFLSTCQFPGSGKPGSSSSEGVLILRFSAGGGLTSRTIAPPAEQMDIATYDVRGTYVSDPNVEFSIPGVGEGAPPVVQLNLEPGDWDIEVDGYNNVGTPPTRIGHGTQRITIVADQLNEVTIDVTPVNPGAGTLDITIEWPSDQVASPSVPAPVFSPVPGVTVSPFALMSPAPRPNYVGYQYNQSDLPAGYYLVTLSILDGTTKVWGTVEAARVMDGLTSSALYKLSKDALSVTITQSMQDPINILFYKDSISASNDITGKDQRIYLSSSGKNPTQLVVVADPDPADPTGTEYTYQWYDNGVAITDQESATITIVADTYGAGMHNFDLVITSGGGSVFSSGRVIVEIAS